VFTERAMDGMGGIIITYLSLSISTYIPRVGSMYSNGLVRPYGGAGGEYIRGSFRLTVWWGVISKGYYMHLVGVFFT
jgi:hypothetical protein